MLHWKDTKDYAKWISHLFNVLVFSASGGIPLTRIM